MSAPTAGEDRQVPPDLGSIFLDHVGHFVPDHEAAAKALRALGFITTPWTVLTSPDPLGGPPVLTGTGNHCLMFHRGYVQILAKTAETTLARQFEQAMERYVGVHLVTFSTRDAVYERARLANSGFAVQPIVDLRRCYADPDGFEVDLAFSVARTVPGAMAEGRIQFIMHRTETANWRAEMMQHPNGAYSLTDQILTVSDLEPATTRWERFLGRRSSPVACGRTFKLERGRVTLCRPEMAGVAVSGPVPPAPFLAAYGIGVSDLAPVLSTLEKAEIEPDDVAPGRVSVRFPPALGVGMMHFLTREAEPPWLAAP
ncbi:VOC family protein [Amorphus sp. 3PC139-8]|uniref:VOC family protein n=1 Tax=Amorphus sp. 3PC139-8 TaxID=2735676 RepID=UPI00345C9C1B